MTCASAGVITTSYDATGGGARGRARWRELCGAHRGTGFLRLEDHLQAARLDKRLSPSGLVALTRNATQRVLQAAALLLAAVQATAVPEGSNPAGAKMEGGARRARPPGRQRAAVSSIVYSLRPAWPAAPQFCLVLLSGARALSSCVFSASASTRARALPPPPPDACCRRSPPSLPAEGERQRAPP